MNGKFKRSSVLLLAFMLLLSMTVAGCGGSGTQPASSSNAGDSKVYEFKLAHNQNINSVGVIEGLDKWVKSIEEKSNGKIKFTIYPSGTLGKVNEMYNVVTSGAADISWGFVPNFPGQFPVTEGIALPMLGIKSSSQGSKALMELYNTTPEMQKEYENTHVLFLYTHDPAPIATKKVKISSADDIKGKKIRVVGDGQTEMIKALGATPLPISSPDIYQSVEKGVVEGYAIGWEGISSFKLQEVTDYFLDADFYVGAFWLVMNKQKWESLPPDIQEVFNDACGMAGSELFGKAWDLGEQNGIDAAKDKGAEIVTLSADEAKKWQELAQPIQDKWASNLEAKGIPGKAILEKMKSIIAKYE